MKRNLRSASQADPNLDAAANQMVSGNISTLDTQDRSTTPEESTSFGDGAGPAAISGAELRARITALQADKRTWSSLDNWRCSRQKQAQGFPAAGAAPIKLTNNFKNPSSFEAEARERAMRVQFRKNQAQMYVPNMPEYSIFVHPAMVEYSRVCEQVFSLRNQIYRFEYDRVMFV